MKVTPKARRLIRLLRPLLRRRGKPGAQLQPFLKTGLLHSPRWGWQENIVGYSLSTKNGQLCLTFFVRCKLHRGRLTSKEFIPEGIRIPGLKNLEILTDVVETGGEFQLHTVAPQESLAHEHALGPGILGALLLRNGDTYLLSCAHVLALAGRDSTKEKPGDFIEMPFRPTSDPVSDRVAILEEGFTPLSELREPNSDFALAKLLKDVENSPVFSGTSNTRIIGFSARRRVQDFPDGLALRLFGKSSPKACMVKFSDAVLRTPARGHASVNEWVYRDLVGYEGECRPGDSGAALLEAGDLLAGIHVGGFEGVDFGFFFPTTTLLEQLGMKPA